MCGRFTLGDASQLKTKYSFSWKPSFNIVPSQNIVVLVDNVEPTIKKWGFNPGWYRRNNCLINARVESLHVKPSFKEVLKCVVLADGWYEWAKTERRKVPYYHHDQGRLLFFGGIYNEMSGCAIVTCPSEGPSRYIHHRQPVLLNESEIGDWIRDSYLYLPNENTSIKVHEVSDRVNNPRNDFAENVEAVSSGSRRLI